MIRPERPARCRECLAELFLSPSRRDDRARP